MKPLDRVLERLEGVRKNAAGFKARCPAPSHGKGRGDRNQSLSVSEGDDGEVLINCFAGCTTETVVAHLGLRMKDLFSVSSNGHRKASDPTTVWEIKDTSGVVQAEHIRFDRPSGKEYLWRLPGAKGWGLEGRKLLTLPLYRSEHIKDWPEDVPVIVTEGEKAADALSQVYPAALGTVTGSGDTPGSEVLEVLKDKNVVLWADSDDPGRAHMRRIAERLQGIAAEVRIFEWEDAPPKGDAADHPAVQSYQGVRELLKTMAAVPPWRTEEGDGHVGTSGKPQTFTATELMASELPPVRWAVPDLVPEGVTLLAGKPKLGKSWLTLGLAVATASGGVALGAKRVEQGEVLYLALEDNRRRLQARLKKLLTGSAPPTGLHLSLEWPRLNDGGVEALETWLQEHPNTRLIVFDTLKKIRPRSSGNRTLYDVDYEALEPLLPIAAEHKVAIIVVHHMRKLPAADPLDEINSTTGLTGGVDGALILKRDRGRADAFLHVTGRDVEAEQELALQWDANTAGWCLVGVADEYRLNEERAAVIRVLKEAREPMSAREVALALGADYEATRQRLYQMSKKGEVQVVGRGRYTLPNRPNNPNNTDDDTSATVRGSGTSPNKAEGNERPKKGDLRLVVRDVRDVRAQPDNDLDDESGADAPNTTDEE